MGQGHRGWRRVEGHLQIWAWTWNGCHTCMRKVTYNDLCLLLSLWVLGGEWPSHRHDVSALKSHISLWSRKPHTGSDIGEITFNFQKRTGRSILSEYLCLNCMIKPCYMFCSILILMIISEKPEGIGSFSVLPSERWMQVCWLSLRKKPSVHWHS